MTDPLIWVLFLVAGALIGFRYGRAKYRRETMKAWNERNEIRNLNSDLRDQIADLQWKLEQSEP